MRSLQVSTLPESDFIRKHEHRKEVQGYPNYPDRLFVKIPLVQLEGLASIFAISCLFHSSYILRVLYVFKIHLRSGRRHPSSRASTHATGRSWTGGLRRFFTLVMPRTLSAKSCRVYPVFSRMASRSNRCNTKSSGRGSAQPCWL